MTSKEMVKLLENNGWCLDRIQGSHHVLKKDNKTLSIPVHGNKDLKKGTENRILRDADLK